MSPVRLLHGSTIVLSAFLLFQIQPILGRLVLPWFGGAAAVWTTCLLFFQTVLLLGYLYSHWSIRFLGARTHAWLHLGLTAASLVVLPIVPDERWQPGGTEDPTAWILGLLAISAGLPYFLLSSTSPLLQAWYAQAALGPVPYRLFALSNLGALAALLSYPVLIEPFVGATRQAVIWSGAYVVFAALSGGLAVLRIRTRAGVPDALAVPADSAIMEPGSAARPGPGAEMYLVWTAMAACPSILLLALTSHMTQDIAPVPFLWVLPLALYLLSFVLCFDTRSWYRRGWFLLLLAPSLGSLTWLVSGTGVSLDLRLVVAILSVAFFVCCMFCHGELARRKPDPRHLTSFYLMIGLGGALGGVFVGLVAPRFFRFYLELPLAIVFCGIIAAAVLLLDAGLRLPRLARPIVRVAAVAGLAAVCLALGRSIRATTYGYLLVDRNFYGALRLSQPADPERPNAARRLLHGAITHGLQPLHADRRLEPTSYYCRESGLGLAILQRTSAGQRVGTIGLGAGTTAAYGRLGDAYRFYEINPLVTALARSQFTYLEESPADVDVVPGDARLALSREPDQNYDVLAVDAFSGDSIPVHLLTREAFELYFRHLKPTGILAIHVSNRYVELEPVVERAASELGRSAIVVRTEDDDGLCYGATWILVGNTGNPLQQPEIRAAGRRAEPRVAFRTWTDDYSNVFTLLK